VLALVNSQDGFLDFGELFKPSEGRMGVIVTFLAVMELVREALIEFVQAEPFAPIHVRGASGVVDHAPVFSTNYGGEADDDDVFESSENQETDEDS
jgi:segregation and condensation protein A